MADVQPGQPAAFADLDHVLAHLLDEGQVGPVDPLDPDAAGPDQELGPQMAEPLGHRRHPLGQPGQAGGVGGGRLGPGERPVLVLDEGQDPGQLPQAAGGLVQLGRPQAGRHPVGQLHPGHVMDGLELEHVGQGGLVAELAGQLPGGREHPGRAGVVAGQPAHPRGGGQQPGPVRVGQVAERGQPAAGHRDRLLPLGGPAELVGHHTAEPPQRLGAPEGLVQPEGLVHDLERLVPASLAAQGHGQPLDQLGQGAPVLLLGARLALEQRDGPGEVVGGLGVGGRLHRPVAGHAQVADEPAVLSARSRPGPGGRRGRPRRPPGRRRGPPRRGGDGEVESAPAYGRGVGQQGLADQLVREGVAGRPAPGGGDGPDPFSRVDGSAGRRRARRPPARPPPAEHPAPRPPHAPAGWPATAGQPIPDNHAGVEGTSRSSIRRSARNRPWSSKSRPPARRRSSPSAKNRVALCGVDLPDGGPGLAGQPGHQRRNVRLGQRSQREAGRQPLAHQLVEDPGQW